MLQAIEAPLYDIGVLSDRGMLPGLDSMSAENVLTRLPLLKYRNAPIFTFAPQENIATLRSTISRRSRSKNSRLTALLPAPSSRPVPATSRPGLNTRSFFRSCLAPLRHRLWQADTTLTLVQRTGDVSADYPVLQTANQNTGNRTAYSLSFVSKVTPASSTQWQKFLRGKSAASTRSESRSGKRNDFRLLILPAGGSGYRTRLLSGFGPRANTAINRRPRTSRSVLPPTQVAWRRIG
jgi:hypothetical protein